MLLIDLEADREADVAGYLAAELGAWGYQVLEAHHRHFDTVLKERPVTVVCGARSQTFSMACKFFYHESSLLGVKVERSYVEAVQRFVRETDDACSTDSVRSRLEHEVRRHATADELRAAVVGGPRPVVASESGGDRIHRRGERTAVNRRELRRSSRGRP